MKLIPTQLGAEPRKLAILGGLAVLLVYFFVSNRSSDDASAPARPRAQETGMPASAPVRSIARTTTRRSGLNRNLQEFRPSLKPKDVDRSTIDPTLHMDLLAKLQDVKVEGASRSLFEFSKEPPPPQEIAGVKEPDPIHVFKPYGPPPPPKPEPPAPPPKAPPIPLKFYGFINPNRTVGPRRAFFLDGDEIIVASEGQMIKNRYKIVRIGINSAVVEDTQFKDSQQTLPLETEQAG
jgi:hypothetical protein